MEPRTEPIQRELVFGTVCGLGLSAILWSFTIWPASATVANTVSLGLACALGGVAFYPPRIGRVSLEFPATLAMLLILGPGAAVLTAALAAAFAALLPSPGGPLRPERVGHRIGARSVAALTGAAAMAFFGGPAVTAGLAPLPIVAFTLVYALTTEGLSRLETWAVGQPFAIPAGPSVRRQLLRGLCGLSLGAGLASSVAFLHGEPTLRGWLLLLPLGTIALLLTRANPATARHLPAAHRGYESVTRALTRAIASQATGQDKDSEERLWRVRDLCVAVGARLGLRDADLQALATGALLHDIGKIAVPEPILTKPGRLSPAEMERVKIHPATGAEILSAIAFPPAIASIVRHHHERWDGRGYPDGLSAEAIPLGARILAAVDCYDAIISNRPYRRALPASEALRHLRHEAGAMFDPEVVDVLMDHLDEQGQMQRFERGSADARRTDHESAETTANAIPRAQRDLEHLYAVGRATRYPIELDESLTLVAARVAALVPARCFVVWRLSPTGDRLRVTYANGIAHGRLLGIDVPLDDRPVAWAVRHHCAIVGHDHLAPVGPQGPSRRRARADLDTTLDDPELRSLSSSLVVPIVSRGEAFGAIALYDDDDRKFTQEDQRLLNSVAGYVARAMARGEHHPHIARTTLTDPLTGLPNARFLWLEGAQRAAIANRTKPGSLGEPYGLIAFRVARLGELVTRHGTETAEKGLIQIAQRLAETCTALETLVRFGHDMFIVLSPKRDGDALVDRWHRFNDAVESRPLDIPSDDEVRPRLVAAHASFPVDGDDLDTLFAVIESRFEHGLDDRRTVVPFRRRTVATKAKARGSDCEMS